MWQGSFTARNRILHSKLAVNGAFGTVPLILLREGSRIQGAIGRYFGELGLHPSVIMAFENGDAVGAMIGAGLSVRKLTRKCRRPMLVALLACTFVTRPSAGKEGASGSHDYFMFVGTYTGGEAQGIYGYRFQPATGHLISLGLVATTPNPSFLAVHPSGASLYAVNESQGAGEAGDTVSAFAIDRITGTLRFLNKVPSRGSGPCHLSIDRTGANLLVANYSSGSVAVFPIRKDGRLGAASASVGHHGSSVDPERQLGPHAHFISVAPDNRFALAADLGLDQVLVYRFDPVRGSLTPNDPPFARLSPGAGPRHLAFHPSGRFVFVINELVSTLSVFAFNAARGTLRESSTVSTLPESEGGGSRAAEVAVDRTGRFLYASNRGHDSIAVFGFDPRHGTLTPVEYISTQGRTPRHFALDPTGSYLVAANQNSSSAVLFRIDPKTGRLSATGDVLKDAGSPVCIVFAPAMNGRHTIARFH
jgi:6-phosphogluconolactonase